MFRLDETIPFADRTNDVLTVGELLIDMISADYEDSGRGDSQMYQKFFGGSPSNIAMNVKRLGIHSLVASAVGEDRFGDFLLQHLKEAGIDTSCVQRVDEATSMVVVTKSRGTPIPIFYRGADYHLAYTSKLEEALLQSKIVHFSCWPISRQPVRHTIEKVIHEARKHQVLISFDPNYHPMIWQKGEDGLAYVKDIVSQVDIVKPSEDDAERIFGKDTPENQLQKFVELGAKLVVMTLGQDGAIVTDGRDTVRYGSVATEVVDTTGAGDAFWSGFYAGIIQGYPVRQALQMGFAVSAYKLQFTGAVVNLPKLEEIRIKYGV